MVLDLIINKNKDDFLTYLKIRPRKQFTMLDYHDGVPVIPDLNGLYKSENAKKIIEVCKANGTCFSMVLSDEYKTVDGFDVHQINGTYYSLLGEDDDAYIVTRGDTVIYPQCSASILCRIAGRC